MTISISRGLLIGGMFVLGGVCLAIPAVAQPPSNVSLDAPGFLIKKPRVGAPEVKAPPLAWPRLDPGAVLCRTEDDLARLGARRAGEAVDGPIDCQVIRAPTAVTIVQRKGPGRAEVKTSNPKVDAMSGWTDAWLPDKGKVGTTSVAR